MSGALPHTQLLTLAEAWASEAGVPPEMVLRNLCDWSMVGAFPDDALVTATGDRVDPFDIFMSRKAMSAGLGGVQLDGTETHNPQWGASLLESVIVSEIGVRAFCERTKTVTPSIRARSFRRLIGVALGWHIAPPPCPDAEEHAAKHQARNSALADIGSLRAILAGLRGQPTRFGPRRTGDGEIDLGHCEKQWNSRKDHALSGIRRCGDAHLEQAVESLDSEWAALLAAEAQKQAAVLAASVERALPAHAADNAETVSSGERSAGPFSAAALEVWYKEEWLIDNTEADKIPLRADDWAAAKARFGDGVPREAVRALRDSWAPDLWKKRGRRKSPKAQCSADLPD